MRKRMKRFMAGLAAGICVVCVMNFAVQADELEESIDIQMEEASSISDKKESAMEKWALPVDSLRWGMTQEEAELSVKLLASQDEAGEEWILESPCEVYQQEMTVTLRFYDYYTVGVDTGLSQVYGAYTVQEYGDLAETITALFGEPYSEGENEYYKKWVWCSEPVSAFYSEDYVRECYAPVMNLLEEDTFESMIKTRMVTSLATITVREDSDGVGDFQMNYSMWSLLESE